jgi:hypothetical protein
VQRMPDLVIQVEVCESRKPCIFAELCGEESRIEDYLSEVECPNAHPVGLETVDYLLNLVGYTLRSGPSITAGEYAVRQGVISVVVVHTVRLVVRIRGLRFSRGLATIWGANNRFADSVLEDDWRS